MNVQSEFNFSRITQIANTFAKLSHCTQSPTEFIEPTNKICSFAVSGFQAETIFFCLCAAVALFRTLQFGYLFSGLSKPKWESAGILEQI
jgi:hypothetical protein